MVEDSGFHLILNTRSISATNTERVRRCLCKTLNFEIWVLLQLASKMGTADEKFIKKEYYLHVATYKWLFERKIIDCVTSDHYYNSLPSRSDAAQLFLVQLSLCFPVSIAAPPPPPPASQSTETKMSNPAHDFHEEEDDQGEIFLDEDDIIRESTVDDEDLPDADDQSVDEPDDDDSMHTFTGHNGELYTVVCSPTDPTLVATGGGDDRGFLWRIGVGDYAFELQGHKDSVSNLSFSTDGLLLASGSLDGIIQIWDVANGVLKKTLEGPGGGIEWVRWHPRGHLVLAGSEDCTVWMWNADNGSYLNMFSGHGSNVSCGDFTPDGKTICTGSADATLRIWNPKSGENIHVIQGHPYHTAGLTCLAINSDSTLAYTGSEDGSIHIVNITTGKVVSSLASRSDSVECIGLAPSSPWAATGSMDKKLVIWDLPSSSARATCEHEDGVTCLTWLGQSNYLATGCGDGKVRVWDSRSGDCVRTFNGHTETIQSLSVSANQEFLVSVSTDGTARVFEIAEYK